MRGYPALMQDSVALAGDPDLRGPQGIEEAGRGARGEGERRGEPGGRPSFTTMVR
jgi:hypothetical protein